MAADDSDSTIYRVVVNHESAMLDQFVRFQQARLDALKGGFNCPRLLFGKKSIV